MKATMSYLDYVRLCTNDGNDFVYIMSLTTDGSLSGGIDELKSTVASEKVSKTGGTYLQFLMTFESGWDFDNYPDTTSFNRALLFGFCAHNFPPGTSIDIRWFAEGASTSNNANAIHHENVTTCNDSFLHRNYPKNDFFVFENDVDLDLLADDSITAVKVTVNTTSNIEIGRLWIGNNFMIKPNTTQDQVFDGGWNMAFQGDGEMQRNDDNSAAYRDASPIQRLISVSKSNMPFSMAYGRTEADSSDGRRNELNDTVSHMYHNVFRHDDIIVLPDYSEKSITKMTGIWGSIQNFPSIQKSNENNMYSTSIDVLEIVDEQDT
jgi:hypothetical protein